VESIDKRLMELGIELPPVFRFPSKTRTGCVEARGILYLSGHGNGLPDWPEIAHRGKVGGDVSEATAYATARVVALSMLSSIVEKYGTLDRVRRVIRLLGLVNSAPGFERQTHVMDGASDVLYQIWGHEFGCHARTAVGVAELPFGLAIEINGEFELA
jgi:enamine deaminase RidA (YjgF/YER057c/UK114 family)